MQRNRWAEAGCCLAMLSFTLPALNLAISYLIYEVLDPLFDFGDRRSPLFYAFGLATRINLFSSAAMGLIALYCSILGFDRSNHLPARKGRWLARIGLACSSFWVIVWIVLLNVLVS